jgi:PAS domain S-box-containing protein
LTLVRDEDGAPKYFQSIVRDIAKRKSIENELQSSEERFRLAFERGPIGIGLIDEDLRFIDVNGFFCEMLGYSEDELIGMTIVDVVTQEDTPKHIELAKQLFRQDVPDYRIEHRMVTKEGNIIWVNLTANIIRSLGGNPLYGMGIIEDITERKQAEEKIRQAYDATLEGWAKTLVMRDRETEGHSQRVVEMTVRLAAAMGLTPDEITQARRGALLHDIGKMGVPDSILQKPGTLTEEEWEIMRQHPIFAYNSLSGISFLRPALDIPYCHHEKWDGSGYPRGLKGEEIPIAARIFAIVDVFDALSTDRPYRDAWSKERIVTYIKEQSGKSFDPKVVEVFIKLYT